MPTRRSSPRSRPTPSRSCGWPLQGDRTQQQLNQYAINVLKKRLETIDGVGEVRLGGRRDRTIRVELLPARMAALGVTAQDINDAFAREHVQMAGGFVVGEKTESLVKLDLEFHSIDALQQMVIGWKAGAPIRLQDVAEVVDGLTDNRQLARFNGETTVGLGIVKVTNTNTVAIVDKVKAQDRERAAPAAAARHAAACRLQRRGVHPRNRQCAEAAPGRRHAARRAGRLAVPAIGAGDASSSRWPSRSR